VRNRSEAPYSRTMPGTPSEWWQQHAYQGYLSKQDAMAYRDDSGKEADWSKLDSDNDGRVSNLEWSRYHGDRVANRSQAPFNPTMPR
jgi:hypothetical protein